MTLILYVLNLISQSYFRKKRKMNNNVKVSESKSLAIDDKNNPEVRMSMSVQIKSCGWWYWNILDQTQQLYVLLKTAQQSNNSSNNNK